MEKVVLDTSVVVKWFVQEEGTTRAVKFLEDYKNGVLEILAPDIIVLELVNALHFGAGFKGEEINNSIKSFYDLDLDLISLSPELIQKAYQYTEKFGIAVYDALFVALANLRKIKLISSDRKHHSKKVYSRTYLL